MRYWEICVYKPRERKLCGGIPGVCLVPFAVVVPLTVLMVNGCRKCKLSEAKMRGNGESQQIVRFRVRRLVRFLSISPPGGST